MHSDPVLGAIVAGWGNESGGCLRSLRSTRQDSLTSPNLKTNQALCICSGSCGLRRKNLCGKHAWRRLVDLPSWPCAVNAPSQDKIHWIEAPRFGSESGSDRWKLQMFRSSMVLSLSESPYTGKVQSWSRSTETGTMWCTSKYWTNGGNGRVFGVFER